MQKEDCETVPRTGHVDVADAKERARWAKAFGVTEPVLLHAVKIVGTSVRDLRVLFCLD